jgi:hypothetical protein
LKEKKVEVQSDLIKELVREYSNELSETSKNKIKHRPP